MKPKQLSLIIFGLIGCLSLSYSSETIKTNIVNNIDYNKPLEEHIERVKDGEILEEHHSFYTYDGDSLVKVVCYEKDSTNKKIYEFIWEDNYTKCVYLTENNTRKKVKETKYNKKGEILEKTVFRSFSYDFGNYSFSSILDYKGEIESKLIYKYNKKGLCTEMYNNFQPYWTNIERYIYKDKTKTTLYEKYHNDVRCDTTDFWLKGLEEVYYDKDFKLLKSSKELHKSKPDDSWYEYEYYPNNSIKCKKTYNGNKLKETIVYKYDDQGRILYDGSIYNYKDFTKSDFITVHYLDENFDKIVSYQIMGLKVLNTYDEFKRPLTKSLENGTLSNPDYEEKYTYNDNVTTIIRKERNPFAGDKKGTLSESYNIKIIYQKVGK